MNIDIDWLLDCDPRPAQIEALRRSYRGYLCQTTKHDAVSPASLPHAGRPAMGWGHFMEMRVGKTPTALNEFLLFKRDYGINKALVLAPNKYKSTWVTEAQRFGVDVPLWVFESSDRKGFAQWMKANPEGLVAVNYEALTYDDNNKLLAEWVDSRTYMVADESVTIKNPNSGFFKNALKLSKPAAVTRPMTGLPTPQAPYDFWAQLRFARKLDGFNFHAFKHTFTQMGGFKNKKVLGLKNEERLHELLRDCCFKARRVDWGTKIESDYETVPLDMAPVQKKAYKEMEDDFIVWLNNSKSVSVDQVITKRMKMQQIASGFILDEHGAVHQFLPFEKTPKLVDLLDRLRNQVPSKTLVIAHYSATILALYEALAEFSPAIICGDRHMKRLGVNAEDEKARFNGSSDCRVAVCQSQAVKYGHTLMGTLDDPCLSIAFFENNYSLDNRAQTEERPQGEGQQAAIHIWDYFSSSVERDIVNALQGKYSVAETVMGHYKRRS